MKQNDRRIGLTGGIGAGKSTAAERFRALGACVLDADAISRRLLEPDGECFSAVSALFPDAVLDGRLDRGRIAAAVFADQKKRKALNAIVHPAVIRCLHRQADAVLREQPDGIVVYDVPLLIECGLYRDMDRVVLVTADDDIRLQRIMLRDRCTREQAEARFLSQMPQREKRSYADAVIDNNGTVEQLYRAVDRVYAEITGKGAAE